MATFTPFGYDVDPSDYGEFETYVQTATDAKNGAAWSLGDLYNYGDTHFHDSFAQAFSETELTIDTVQNYARVCQAFPRQRRNYPLSFGHYDTVRTLKPELQDKLLSDAVKQRWSRDDLRKARRDIEGTAKLEAMKGTVRVRDLIIFFTQDKGLSEDTVIDITAKLSELRTESEVAAA